MRSFDQLELGIETGIVKFFDSRDNKRYGFIVLDSGEEIFFHYNDGRIPGANICGLDWYMPNIDSETVLDYPKAGDRLFFERSKAKKGPKASPWTSQEYYKETSEKMWCPCGHHLEDHDGYSYCRECDCPNFGEPTENWETHSITYLDNDPCSIQFVE